MSSLIKEDAADMLAKARMFVIDEKVDDKTVELVESITGRLLIAGAPDVVVIIDSEGGIVEAGLKIYDILDTYPGNKTAIVYGSASSIAAVILQACDVRLCARHASMLIHDLSKDLSLTIARDHRKFARWVRDRERVQDKIYRVLSGRTGLSIEKIRTLSEQDRQLSFEAALKYKLVDRILTKADVAKHFRPEVLEKLKKQPASK